MNTQQCAFYTLISGFKRANSEHMVFLYAILFLSVSLHGVCFFSLLVGCCSLLSARTHQVTWDQLVDCINKIKGKHVLFIRICHVHCTTLAFIRPTEQPKIPKHTQTALKAPKATNQTIQILHEHWERVVTVWRLSSVCVMEEKWNFVRPEKAFAGEDLYHYNHAHYRKKHPKCFIFVF